MRANLTDTAIKNAKPRPKAYKLSDGGGLCLEISPAGGKLWRLKYRIQDKEKRLAIGAYPSIGLKEARARRDAAKEQIANGIDPSAAKKEGLISVLSAPLMVSGKAIGLIRVYSDQERDFSPEEIEFMDAAAGVSALAIQNARLYARVCADLNLQMTYTYQVFED